MKSLASILLLVVFSIYSNAKEVTGQSKSPDSKYELRLIHLKGKSPRILIVELASNKVMWNHDFESVGLLKVSSIECEWSPNSKYLGLTVPCGQTTVESIILQISKKQVNALDLAPIPAKFDTESYTTRGGVYFSNWKNSKSFWVSDNSKNRCFRYSINAKNVFEGV